MSTKRGDMPAMPPNAGWRDNDPQAQGMTIREQFAMAAMQGLLARDGTYTFKDAAIDAVDHADALLAELERTK